MACDDEELRQALGAAPLVLHVSVLNRNEKALREAIDAVSGPDAESFFSLDMVNSKGETALHAAAAGPWRDGVGFLLQAKAEVNMCDDQRSTPLHRSCESGCPKTVALLVEARALVNVKDVDVNK